ncbi:glycosyltransferase family 4 protein [Actinomadura sp. WMMB 499]|uniref:glycosyltransferase family 4 protein n=1 Tax=Actinomadura sp. WMMB 499 TaxID=1219491 RepID=UPI00159D2FC1|nr:glycosyltransferase family 4 protein [Actinomadura sp. WMMB 499]
MLLNAGTLDGTVRSTFTLADELSRRHDVEIIGVRRTSDAPAFPLSDRVRLRHLVDERADARPGGWRPGRARRLLDEPSTLVHPEERSYRFYSALTDERIPRALRRLRADVLVTTRAGLNIAAARFAPSRVTRIGQEHLHLGIHEPGILAEIERWYPKLDAVTTLTEADRDSYRSLIPDLRVRTLRNGLPDRVYPRSRQENKTVVAAGRLAWIKGYDLLITAFARVAEKHPEWTLRIHGKGDRLDRLRRQVTRLGLYNNVMLMGPSDDIESEFAKASILAVPSRAEAFGMTIVEGFACGLPAVAFDCPRGPREIITAGHDGLLVPPGDPAALGDALVRLIDDEGLRHRMAAAAPGTARRYAVSSVAADWEDVLADLRR